MSRWPGSRPRIALVAVAAFGAGCATPYVAPPDPIPVLGAELIAGVGGCADVRDGVTADGTPIVLFQCHGSPNQHWFIGRGQIAESFGSCMDVQGGVALDGSPILLVSCNGRASQRWRVVDGEIVGIGDKCLDSAGGVGGNLNSLVLAPCTGAPSQRWTIQ